MSKVLVTGAEGFIGSHVVEALVRDGRSVRAHVLYNSFNSWGWLDRADDRVKESLDIFAGDVRDPHGVKKAMQGCDIVLHLAALIAIPYSYHSPDTYVDTNVKGTLNILQAARELGLQPRRILAHGQHVPHAPRGLRAVHDLHAFAELRHGRVFYTAAP